MNLRDLPHTCACTWCCIQQDGGKEIMALPVLRTRELQNLFKLNFTLAMRLTLVILGRPPGGALFNVKSRTLKVLTMVFCWWELNIVTMATPLFFFFFYREQDAGTNTNSKTRYGLRKNLLRGTHIPPPHLKFAKLQVNGVQVSFRRYSFVKAYRGWCSQHVRRCCLSVILLDLPLERLATKNTRRKNTS